MAPTNRKRKPTRRLATQREYYYDEEDYATRCPAPRRNARFEVRMDESERADEYYRALSHAELEDR